MLAYWHKQMSEDTKKEAFFWDHTQDKMHHKDAQGEFTCLIYATQKHICEVQAGK